MLAPGCLFGIVQHVVWRDTVVDANDRPPQSGKEALRMVVAHALVTGELNRVIHGLVLETRKFQVRERQAFVCPDQ